MARLPQARNLGEGSDALSRRPIASFDTTAIGEGMVRGARGLASVGATLEQAGDVAARIGARNDADQDRLTQGIAKSHLLTSELKVQQEWEQDTNPDNFTERWSKRLQEEYDRSIAAIPDPQKRELFRLEAQPRLQERLNRLQDQQKRLERDRDVSIANEGLENLGKLYAQSPDELTKREILEGGNSIIEGLRERGYIGEEETRKYRTSWVEKRAVEWAKSLSPAQRIAMFGGFEGALVQKESSGRANIVNDSGYAGLYQFGAPRLADLGVYNPGPGESVTRDGWGGRKWTGTFNIPGHPEVKTIDDFLTNPAAQKAAFALHRERMDNEIQRNGLDKYIGQTVAGVLITRDGLHGMMHLAGAKGAKQTLESGGRINPRDKNGTSALAYAKQFGQPGSGSVLARFVPESEKPALVEAAEREQVKSQIESTNLEKAQHAARMNAFEVAILDGEAGLTDIEKAREEGWLTDADDIRKLQSEVERVNREAFALRGAQEAIANPSKVWDPTDGADKKKLDLLFDSVKGGERLVQGDEQFVVNDLVPLVKRTAMVPGNAKGTLLGMLRSNDHNTVNRALSVMDQLDRTNSEAFSRDFGEYGIRKLMTWRTNAPFRKPEEVAELLRKEDDPSELKVRKELEKEGQKILPSISDSAILDHFDPGALSLGPDAPADALVAKQLRVEFDNLFVQEFGRTGNKEQAQENALKLLGNVWGMSRSDGGRRLMKYPPEKYYPSIRGSHDWMRKQAVEELSILKTPTGAPIGGFALLSDARTEAEISKNVRPSYLVGVIDENGHRLVLPRRYTFDHARPLAVVQQEEALRHVGDVARQDSEPSRESLMQTDPMPDPALHSARGDFEAARARAKASRDAQPGAGNPNLPITDGQSTRYVGDSPKERNLLRKGGTGPSLPSK